MEMNNDLSDNEEMREFLRKRGIREMHLLKMENEKIGPDVIFHLTDSQLEEFIPRLGDRIALRQFLKLKTNCEVPNSTRKKQLIDRLRQKLETKSCLGQNDIEGMSIKKKKTGPHYQDEKQIILGWICRMNGESKFKQVRERGGGGARKIKVPKLANKEYLQRKGVELFFPDGKSPKGALVDFDIDLLDFKNNKIDEVTTVENLLESTGLSVLRFYLATTQKTDIDEESDEERVSLEKSSLLVNDHLVLNKNPNLQQDDKNEERYGPFETLDDDVVTTEYSNYHVVLENDSDDYFLDARSLPDKTTQDSLNELINSLLDKNETVSQITTNVPVNNLDENESFLHMQNDSVIPDRLIENAEYQSEEEFKSVKDVLKTLQQKINFEEMNKFNIFRNDIFQCCVRAMRRKTFDPFNKISVKFSDYEGNSEGAVDEGGPTREMFRLALEYLKDSEMFVGQKRRHITLNHRCLEKNFYFEAGRLMALSLVHGGPGPHFFSPTLFSLMFYGHENTTPTLDDVEEEIRSKLAKLEELVELSDLQEFVITENIFSIAGFHYITNLDEKSTIVAGTLKFFAFKRVETAINQFIEGIKTCNIYEYIRLYPHLFQYLFCEEKLQLTADDLENIFVIKYSPMGSNKRLLENRAVSYFRDYLVDCEENLMDLNDPERIVDEDVETSVSLTDILVFGTGADVVPPLGFPQIPKILFLHNETTTAYKYPMANTCALEFKLPTCHGSYEDFKANMNFGIANCKSFGFA
ncbi:unnamed protein product [Brassicogethes aeneus]|uniref:HECT domain-containing protein n=1 Tax=Brassicogethes aeneus TaxID=1431903 RepID=A0A9P0BBN1_BRAAE|nr:unnamed protein product [Brassicogethes aeneus]